MSDVFFFAPNPSPSASAALRAKVVGHDTVLAGHIVEVGVVRINTAKPEGLRAHVALHVKEGRHDVAHTPHAIIATVHTMALAGTVIHDENVLGVLEHNALIVLVRGIAYVDLRVHPDMIKANGLDDAVLCWGGIVIKLNVQRDAQLAQHVEIFLNLELPVTRQIGWVVLRSKVKGAPEEVLSKWRRQHLHNASTKKNGAASDGGEQAGGRSARRVGRGRG